MMGVTGQIGARPAGVATRDPGPILELIFG